MKTNNRTSANTTNTTNAANRVCFTRMASSGGRFFGILLSDGQKVNAQFRSQSEKYVTVYDKHAKQTRRLLKSRIVNSTV
jgi:hypothetical protein